MFVNAALAASFVVVPQLDGYERRIGRYGTSLGRALIAAAGVGPGQRALDVGCGTGALTEQLVQLLGAEHVAAADPDPAAVAATRARLPDIHVVCAPGEELPFADGEFDAVLSQLVVSFFADPVAGVTDMRRVAKPGGAIVTCVWDFADGMRMLREFWDAAAEVDPSARDHDQAATHRFASAESLAELWHAAGLSDVTTGALTATADYRDFDDLWEPLLVPDGAPGRYLEHSDDERTGRICERLFERLGRPAGSFTLEARAWYALGWA